MCNQRQQLIQIFIQNDPNILIQRHYRHNHYQNFETPVLHLQHSSSKWSLLKAEIGNLNRSRVWTPSPTLFVLGMYAAGAATDIHIHGRSDCEKVLQYPLPIVGLVVMVVSAFGMVVSL